MLIFRPIQYSDRDVVRSYLDIYENDTEDEEWSVELNGCDYSFASIICWRDMYLTQIAEEDGALFFRYKDKEQRYAYLFPLLKTYGTESYKTDLKDALCRIAKDTLSHGDCLRMTALNEKMVKQVEMLTMGKWTAMENRNAFEYIYTSDSLARLNGKHLQPKRNYLNRFRREVKDWRIEDINEGNVYDCKKLFKKWGDEHEEGVGNAELLSFNHAVQHYAEIGLEGIILYSEGQPIAFVMGTPLHTTEKNKTFDLMYEKADRNIVGAYTCINQQMAERLKERGYVYINREDDMGLENLRKSKLSYHPQSLMEVYTIQSQCGGCMDEVVVTHPRREERRQVMDMWQRIFKDEDRFMKEYMEKLYDEDECYVTRDENGEVASFMQASEITLENGVQKRRGVYIYAVMTSEKERGKNRCRQTIEKAEEDIREKGVEYAVLMAADTSLSAMYEKMGYVRVRQTVKHWTRDLNDYERYVGRDADGWRINVGERQFDLLKEMCACADGCKTNGVLMIKRLTEGNAEMDSLEFERGILMEC